MYLDAHHHLWHYSEKDYGWITPQMTAIRRDFLPGDLRTAIAPSKVTGTIAVQARQSYEETDALLNYAHQNDFIKGVVGWVDLCDPQVEKKISHYSRDTRMVGVRHVLQDEPDDLFMLRDDFMRGLKHLNAYNLTYDILIFPRHLPVAVKLVSTFPEQRFVLDHIAKPFIKDGLIEPWRSEIRKLAEFSNVYCKISGMVTEATWHQWSPETFFPYLHVVFNAFGEDRVMMGSDWPVCLLSADTYKDVVDIPLAYLKDAGSRVVDKFMGENGRRFYGIRG